MTLTHTTKAARQPLPYSSPTELQEAFKAGQAFTLHYHGKQFSVTRIALGHPHVAWVYPPSLPVGIYPDGRCKDGPAIWLEHAAEATTAALLAETPVTVRRALETSIAEMKRANETTLRECGVGVVDLNVIARAEQALAALAADDPPPRPNPDPLRWPFNRHL